MMSFLHIIIIIIIIFNLIECNESIDKCDKNKYKCEVLIISNYKYKIGPKLAHSNQNVLLFNEIFKSLGYNIMEAHNLKNNDKMIQTLKRFSRNVSKYFELYHSYYILFRRLLKELDKVDSFFSKLVSEISSRMHHIVEDNYKATELARNADEVVSDLESVVDSIHSRKNSVVPEFIVGQKAYIKPKKGMTRSQLFHIVKKNRKELKLLYQQALALKQFATLNYTALRKLLKKWDKHVPVPQNNDRLKDQWIPTDLRKRSKPLPFSDRSATHTKNKYPSMNELSSFISASHIWLTDLYTPLVQLIRNSDELQKYDFINVSNLESLINEIESSFASFYAQGNLKAAVMELTRDSKKTRLHMLDVFIWGINVGIILCSVIAIAVITDMSPLRYPLNFIAVMPVLRLSFCVILYVWLWGTLVYTWKHVHLNYIYIFDFNPATVLKHFQVFKMAAIFTSIWALATTLYVGALHTSHGSLLNVPAQFFVFIPLVALFIISINPLKIIHRPTRWMLLSTVAQVVVSPFSRVRFVHVYVGDVLTSLVHPLSDLEYTMCYYFHGDFLVDRPKDQTCHNLKRFILPIVMSAPYVFRGMQNIRRYWETGDLHPHITNAGKYLSGVIVTVLGLLYGDFGTKDKWDVGRALWMSLFLFEVLYMYAWDIFMDWGFDLFNWNQQHPGLRKELLYPNRWTYYFAIISNFFARFVWALTITPLEFTSNKLTHQWLVLALSVCEILRRFQWTFFRVENEFLSNFSKLRSVKTVPIALENFPDSGTASNQGLANLMSDNLGHLQEPVTSPLRPAALYRGNSYGNQHKLNFVHSLSPNQSPPTRQPSVDSNQVNHDSSGDDSDDESTNVQYDAPYSIIDAGQAFQTRFFAEVTSPYPQQQQQRQNASKKEND